MLIPSPILLSGQSQSQAAYQYIPIQDAFYLGDFLGRTGHPICHPDLMKGSSIEHVKACLTTLSDSSNSSVLPQDFAFFEHLAVQYGQLQFKPGTDTTEILTQIRQVYKTRFGYTPTPVLQRTPDRHWAKISLDLLYKQGILNGDKYP